MSSIPQQKKQSPRSPPPISLMPMRRSTQRKPPFGLGREEAARTLRGPAQGLGADDRAAGRICRLITLENGKARADAMGEATYAAEFFRWFAEEAVRADG
jgi:hypothetical protein